MVSEKANTLSARWLPTGARRTEDVEIMPPVSEGRANRRGRHRIFQEPLTLDDRLLSPADLAARWGISRNTLANQRSRGEGPRFVRFPSGRIRYPWSAIAAYEAGLDVPIRPALESAA